MHTDLMATKTIRIEESLKEELDSERKRYSQANSDKADAVTVTDTSWYGYIMKLGLKVFKSNRKESVK